MKKENSEMSKEDLRTATAGFFIIVLSVTLFLIGIIELTEYVNKHYGNKNNNPTIETKGNWENPWDDSRWQDNKVPWLEHTQGYP